MTNLILSPRGCLGLGTVVLALLNFAAMTHRINFQRNERHFMQKLLILVMFASVFSEPALAEETTEQKLVISVERMPPHQNLWVNSGSGRWARL
jgi:hypothetical protein